VLDQRGRFLIAALGFAGLRSTPSHPALHALHRWLDTWRGIGDVAVGMARQGYDLQLTRYDEQGRRATFYMSGMAALADQRDGHGVGGDAVAGGAGGGARSAAEGRRVNDAEGLRG